MKSVRVFEGKAIAWVVAMGLVGGACVPIPVVTGYTVAVLSVDVEDSYYRADAINDSGQVAGLREIDSDYGGFVGNEADGAMDLSPWAEYGSCAYAIDNSGRVYGTVTDASDAFRASVWDAANGMQELIPSAGDHSKALGVNRVGQVVGYARFSGSYRAFLWDGQNGIQNLGTLGGDRSEANAVNDSGQVVGTSKNSEGKSRAFLWDAEKAIQNLGTLGGDSSDAYGINKRGQVVGCSLDADDEYRAFLWDEEKGMRNLGTLGGTKSSAQGINDDGVVIGWSAISNGDRHAFVWDEENGMRDLNELTSVGFVVELALAINKKGQIGAAGAPDGEHLRALVLTPVYGKRGAVSSF